MSPEKSGPNMYMYAYTCMYVHVHVKLILHIGLLTEMLHQICIYTHEITVISATSCHVQSMLVILVYHVHVCYL